ncbi:hypothetical protein ACVW17_003117 [Bradyrhizobium sp. USDA 4473]
MLAWDAEELVVPHWNGAISGVDPMAAKESARRLGQGVPGGLDRNRH